MRQPATRSTPEIDLNFSDGEGWIRGPCASDHASAIFGAISAHLGKMLKNDQGREYRLKLYLYDLPTTTVKSVDQLLANLEAERDRGPIITGAQITISWSYPPGSTIIRKWVESFKEKYPNLISEIGEGEAYN